MSHTRNAPAPARPGRSWHARPAAAIAAALVGAVLVLTGTASPAAAHSELIGSDPAADTQLDVAPDQVRLTFSDEINPEFADAALTVGDGPASETPTIVEGADVILDVPAVAADASSTGQPVVWQVTYRVVSADGHPVSGTVAFTVTTSAQAPPTEPGATATPTAEVPTAETPAAESSAPTAATPAATAADDAAASGEEPSGAPWGWLGAGAVLVLAAAAATAVVTRRRGERSS